MRRRTLIVGLTASSLAVQAWAQADWRQKAVPLYGPLDFVHGFNRAHAWPRARAWQASCTSLVRTLANGGQVADARQAW